MINGIVRQLESQSDGDIPTDRIGELVMEGLKALDDIADVRFASVYRNFREARETSTPSSASWRRSPSLRRPRKLRANAGNAPAT